MPNDCIKKLNHLLEGLCITANALDPDFHARFDCYVELLHFDKNLAIEDNFKHFFRVDSSWKKMEKMKDPLHIADWEFQMSNMGTPDKTMSYFFHRNLFFTLNARQLSVISGDLKSHFEGMIEKLISAQQGYICPPSTYIPAYVQHWQHLYLQGTDATILITFEANT
ncbi:hypothetical protein [Acinetobacter rudis]|uniref:Uncharacterized protein n=1 Tax=Acinetobacter rudis TaxID=632955 RepID=A0AAW8JC17_9GAMM|nr:hypothetical protein [Acinetobacter rudis]MDQ8936231.1 hypothetical protein [Acinetobacter rudis]MDQ8953945.1 hypothetical protein [Acinetobacter rudis]MDQ9018494.1 hypothetical protein [Acinetobacter rudis]